MLGGTFEAALLQRCLLSSRNTTSARLNSIILNCRSTTTDGATAMTPSPSTLPCVIIILSSLLLFPPGSHHPVFSSCLFSSFTFFEPCYLSVIQRGSVNIRMEPPDWLSRPHVSGHIYSYLVNGIIKANLVPKTCVFVI